MKMKSTRREFIGGIITAGAIASLGLTIPEWLPPYIRERQYNFKDWDAAIAYLRKRWGRDNVDWQEMDYGFSMGLSVQFPDEIRIAVSVKKNVPDFPTAGESTMMVIGIEDAWAHRQYRERKIT